MALVEFNIGRSKYQIECPEAEKSRLLELAKKMNDRVNKLSQNFKNTDEKTLLVISSLMMEDEIELQNNYAKNSPQINNDAYESLTQNIDNMTNFIEKLAKKIENY